MNEKITPYQMAINNVAAFIASPENQANIDSGTALTAFDASFVLSIAFCKAKEEIAKDILDSNRNNKLKPSVELFQPRFPRDSRTFKFIDPIPVAIYIAIADELGLTAEVPTEGTKVQSWVKNDGNSEVILLERDYGISFDITYMTQVHAVLIELGFQIK